MLRHVWESYELWLFASYWIWTSLDMFENLIRSACGHVDVGTSPHQVLASTLTLSQPGGADYAHPILMSTPSFESHRRACTWMVTIHIFFSLNKFRHVREFYHIVLSGLKEYLSILSIRSILSLRNSLSSDLELDSFESCFQKILSLCTVSR